MKKGFIFFLFLSHVSLIFSQLHQYRLIADPINYKPFGPQGIIAMSTSDIPINQTVLDNPYLTGIFVRTTWQKLEPTKGNFDWSYLDNEIGKVIEADKLVWLMVTSGGKNTPAWVNEEPKINLMTYIISNPYNKQAGDTIIRPIFWDTVFLKCKLHLISELGKKYGNIPQIASVSAHNFNGLTDDFNFKIKPLAKKWEDLGYSLDTALYCITEVIEATLVAFPYSFVRIPFSVSNNKSDPWDIADSLGNWIVKNHPSRCVLQRHQLSAKIDVSGWQDLYYKYSPNMAAEMVFTVWHDKYNRMGGKNSEYGKTTEGAAVLESAIYNGYKLGCQYIEVFNADIIHFPESIKLGADLLTIPSKPENLKIRASKDLLVLSWDPSSDIGGVKSYNIFRDSEIIGKTNKISFTTQNLKNKSVFYITSEDACGNISDYSEPVLW